MKRRTSIGKRASTVTSRSFTKRINMPVFNECNVKGKARRAFPSSLAGSALCVALLVGLSATRAAAEDWVQFRHDYNNSGQSGETSISSGNVANLQVRWYTQIGTPVTYGGTGYSTPAVVGGVVYATDGVSKVYALDASTGVVKSGWPVSLSGVSEIASSPTVVNGILYVGAGDGQLHAISTSTHTQLWSYPGTPVANAEVYSSPVVYNGVVYFGRSSHDDLVNCVAGHIIALKAQSSLSMVWDTPTAPIGKTGAGVWSSPAIDTSAGILYVGTGNAGSPCSPSGGVPLADSILAVSLSSGSVINSYQVPTSEVCCDYDFGSSPVLSYLFNDLSYPQCTGNYVKQYFVLEAYKDGNLFSVQRNNSGLVAGTGYGYNLTNPSSAILTASPGRFTTTTSCPNGHHWYTADSLVLPSTQTAGILGSAPLFEVQNNLGLQTIWAQSPPHSALSSPAIIEDLAIYAEGDACSDGKTVCSKLHAYKLDGSQSWMVTAGSRYPGQNPGQIWASPAISGGRIYITSSDGYVYCISVDGS